MSVVVRMEMPKNNCEMAVEIKGAGDWCPISARVCDYYSTKKMLDWCPIICQLPEGHGRLVDADELKAKQQEDADLFINAYTLMEKSRRDEALNAVANIVNAPTIVPADTAERSET